MTSFYQSLKINALYEIKILLRSWFFKIFAVGSILGLAGLDVLFHSSVSPVPRFLHPIDSFLPYMNIALPQYVLIIVLVFLATDLYKRDKKFNTSDVIYIRDMSNLSFILGRISGVLLLFFSLNFIYLLVGLIINIFFSTQPVVWQAYLIYPFLLSLPAIVFSVGLTMFLMYVIRNQAVVIILVVGLLIASIDLPYLVLDVLAVKLPFIYSDFNGLSNPVILISQRMGWFIFGVILMLLSILMVQRLPQSNKARVFIFSALVVLPILCAISFFNYLNYYQTGQALRDTISNQLKSFSENADFQVKSYDIKLRHAGNRIVVNTELRIENRTNHSLDSLQLLLNPGLKIKQVKQAGKIVPFGHEGLILKISLLEKLEVDKSILLEIAYSGHVDDRIAYPDIAGEERQQTNYIWLFRSEPRFAFNNPDYLRLPPSLYWYPKIGHAGQRDLLKPFSRFNLEVETRAGLTAVSQGKVIVLSESKTKFKNRQPLKEISLVIGSYTKQSIWADSLEVAVYSLAKHDYYKEFFKEIGDTLPELVASIMQDFENKIGLDYPFSRLSLVETPIHLYAYQRNGRANADLLQPGQVWLPENLATVSASYFKYLQQRRKRFGNRGNQTFTDLEKEIMLFRRFATNTFTGARGWRFGGGDMGSFIPDLTIYPLFLNFVLKLGSAENQGFAIALESNLRLSASPASSENRWALGALTDAEEANLALADTSLDYIMKTADRELVNKVLAVKGSYLLKKIEYALGKENFTGFMASLVQRHRFKSVPIDSIASTLKQTYQFDLEDELRRWQHEDKLPGFLIDGFKIYQIRDGERLRYQTLFIVKNPTETDGLIEVSFSFPGEGRRRFTEGLAANNEKWLFEIKAGKSNQIGIVLDTEPRTIRVNTLVSQNLPATYTFLFDDAQLRINKKAIDGISEIDWKEFDAVQNNSIVDDNNNEFGYVQPQYHSKLKEWVHKGAQKEKEEYAGFKSWRIPTQWQKIKFPSLYGQFVHSAYYARSGSGERKATWMVEIPKDGVYQVFIHVPDRSDFRLRRRGGGSFGVQKYIIYHAEGEDEIELDFSEAEPGWNYLESYFF